MLLKLRTILLSGLVLCTVCCHRGNPSGFVTVKDGSFELGGQAQYYAGTNFWYGAILASEGRGGDRVRLGRELDSLHAIGLDNLRILVGADGQGRVPTRAEPTLQLEPGVYNDTIFKGLDYLLVEMGKRDMKAVLYVNNSWEWSGGYGMYLEWAGAGKALIPAESGYTAFMEQMAQYATNRTAQALFEKHLQTVVSRVNSLTGKPYSEDPAIFSWQISNEPRCFSDDPAVQDAFVDWLHRAARIIKQNDPNHLVSVGSEGSWGCENNLDLYERIHKSADIDYLTMHIWPYNWGWVSENGPQWGIDNAEAQTRQYMEEHIAVAERLGKPLVLEEFGFPRDDFRFAKGTPTTGRDRYYSFVFNKLIASAQAHGRLAGANFWGWGGLAQPRHEQWQPGDDYVGDPPQEPQGLYSVFADDASSLAVVREATAKLAAPAFAVSEPVDDWMFTVQDQKPLKVVVRPMNGFHGKVSVTADVVTDKGEPFCTETLTADLRKGADTLYFPLGLEPGFYRVRLGLTDSGLQDQVFNIGCNPEQIVSPQDKQPDFDAFWEENLAELKRVPMRPKMTRLPEHSSAERTMYRVDMTSFGGKMISGIVLIPNKEGRFPAKISYMGYGADVWYPDPSSEPDLVDFTLSVRDQGLNRTPGQGWVRQGLGSKETYYYRGAFLDCVRAIDFVASLPQVDPDRIVAEGGSQGGAFTLVAASLDHRLKAIAPFVPFLSDYPDYFQVAEWPGNEILPAAKTEGIADADLYRTLSYFDVKNFTDWIECPVLMGFGLQDPVCPPHTNFSGYNLIRTDKQWICFPFSGHHVEEEAGWWEARNAFFKPYLY